MKNNQRLDKQTNFKFIKTAIFAFTFLKLIHAQLLLNHAYLGADGPNYIKGFLAILEEGFFSENIHLFYWPAGYSALIYFCYQLIPSNPLMTLSFVQIVMHGLSVYIFMKSLLMYKTPRVLNYLIASFLLISPTLYFMSLSVGYESLISSFYLLLLGLYIQYRTASGFRRNLILTLISLFMSLIVIMQPRFLITNLILILVFQLLKVKMSKIAIVGLILVLIGNIASPIILASRNERVHGVFMISSNFADTLLIGAGDAATGAYNENPKGIDCKLDLSSVQTRENSLTRCVVSWYLENPRKGLNLAKNKFLFFWTPWSGPISKGTLSNNPWRKIAPADALEKLLETNFQRNALTLLSWVYVFASLLLLSLGGLFAHRSKNEIIRNLGVASIAVVLANTLISVATIGDNRFRVPILPFIVILHVFGIIEIRAYCKRKFVKQFENFK